MKKSDKIFLIFFLVIVSFSMIYLFQSSYAKYRKQITGELDTTIASWNIKVNTETINNHSTLTNSITPILNSNQYVKTGVIAPGSTGYFVISIDATDVDVDFTYEIEATPNEDTPLDDLILTGYEIDGVSHTFTGEAVVTGDIVKNSTAQSITIYFEWDDDPLTNTMDNQDDTEYAIDANNTNTKIDVSIHFTQKRS